MSLNRNSLARPITDHLSTLTQSDVPNYKVSASAAGSLLLVSCVSGLSGCGSSSTYLALCLAALHAAMFVNQNWKATSDYTTTSINAMSTQLTKTVAAINQNEWINNKYNTASKNINSMFGRVKPKTATRLQQVEEIEKNDNEIVIKKAM